MPARTTKPKAVTRGTLKERGWTDGMVDRFLREPDRREKNPHQAAGPPMRLYNLDRVERAEAEPEWQAAARAAAAHRPARTQAAAKAVKTKVEKTLARFDRRFNPVIDPLPWDELIAHACAHYNDRHGGGASPACGVGFLHRIAVNYLRHRCTAYDCQCAALPGRVGKEPAFLLIRRKALAAIRRAYPLLAGACDDQEQDGYFDW